MFRYRIIVLSLLGCTCLCAAKAAFSGEANPSVTQTGMTGLNTIPSARMDSPGTIRVGLSHGDPYNHAFIGFQVAKPLYINLRQTMEVSSILKEPDLVHPGLDVKLQLADEGRYRPAIAFGIDGALGSKRMSSEYFTLSKRIYDFDVTAGMGWGRYGSAGHIANPLSRFSSHFDQDRDFNSNDPSSTSTWFTGKEIGFFGGVEYFTPIEGLSFKADFNGDSYIGESRAFGFERPSPWSVGINYSPKPWVSIGAALQGTDKIMARLSFQSDVHTWKTKSYKESTVTNFDEKSDNSWLSAIFPSLKTSHAPILEDVQTNARDISGVLHLNSHEPPAMQIGRAARHLLEQADKNASTVSIIPVTNNLRGKSITFTRRDLEMAKNHRGSPEEIWRNLSFGNNDRKIGLKEQPRLFKFAPEMQLSLGEEETTHLFRASVVGETQKQWGWGFFSGSGLRLNIADNLSRLAKFKTISYESVRGDADLFTQNRVNLDRAFFGFMRTPLPDFHFALTAGYLEEMYAGAGGEVLYRPFGSPFSIGADVWQLYKRDGISPLALGFTGEAATSGFLNVNYEIPETDITAFANVGKFIGGDVGVNTGAQMTLDSGVKVKGFVRVSNSDDQDVFGSDRNVYAGLQMTVPLGNIPFIPQGTETRLRMEPIGRDDAAMLDKPIDLYSVTEPVSYRHLGQNWQAVLK